MHGFGEVFEQVWVSYFGLVTLVWFDWLTFGGLRIRMRAIS